jgi:hypothetical protein
LFKTYNTLRNLKWLIVFIFVAALNAVSLYADAAAYFNVSAPLQNNSAMPFYITVTAMTSSGTVATDYTGVVTFDSGAALYVMPDDYGFTAADNGSHLFSARIMTSGDEVLDVQDINNAAISNSTIITILPASAAYYTLSAPSSAKAGVPFFLTLTAKDSYNNVVTNYNGTASFASTDPAAQLPSDTTFINDDAGSILFSITLKTKGTMSISAKDLVNNSISGSSNAIALSSGTISDFAVNAPVVANPNTSFNLAVTAQDAYGNIVDGYTGTVHFTSTDIGAVLPGNYTYQAGDYGNRVFSATLVNSGSQTISVNDTLSTTTTGISSAINVNQVFNPYAQPLMLTSYIPDAAIYQYIYLKVSAPANTVIPDNAYIEYDVFMPSYNPDFYTGTDFEGSFGDLRDYGQSTQSYIIDQNGIRCHPSMDLSQYASGRWYHRKFNIGALGGTTYNELDLAQDTGNSGANGAPSNQAGTFNSFFNNIEFTNSSGTVLKSFYASNSAIPYSGAVSLSGATAGNRGAGGINAGPTPPAPVNNFLYIVKDFSLASTPAGSVIADGAHSITVTAFLFGPTNAAVAWTLTDFKSDRAADSVYPVLVSANAEAVTGTDGLANARITSTQAGQADITVNCAHMSKVISINFTAGAAVKAFISPPQSTTETGVHTELAVGLEDAFGNFSSTAKSITITSTSPTMRFSSDNGVTWYSSLTISALSQGSITIADTTAGTATVSALSSAMTSASAVVYINNALATSISLTPSSTASSAGTAVTMTAWAMVSNGVNGYCTNLVTISSASPTMEFSQDGMNYSHSLTMYFSGGRADFYCYDTKVGSGVAITARSAGLTPGTAYFTTTAGNASLLSGSAGNYSVIAGQSVTITAVVTDSYGNPVSNQFVTFTAQVEGGSGDALITTPNGNSTNASGQVTAVFRTKSTTADLNYVIINSGSLLGTTITISGSAAAAFYSFLPSPLSGGANQVSSLFINAKDSGGFNAPAPGHSGVFVSVTYPAASTAVYFSGDSGTTWYNSVTATLDASGAKQLLVKSHIPGTYYIVGSDTASTGDLIPVSTTFTVSTAYYISVSPSTSASANAGSTMQITAQIVDQNGTPAAIPNVAVSFSTTNGSISPVTVYTDSTGKAVSTLTLAIGAYAAHVVTVNSTNPNSTASTGIITSLPVVSFSIAIPASAYINTVLQAVVRVKDAYGQTISNYTGTIHFTSVSAAALPADYTFTSGDAGVKYFTFSLQTASPFMQTISAADTSNSSINGTSNVILMYLNPTPSPSISPTKTMTFTKTPTPTFSSSPTVTPTYSNSPTLTITMTRTVSPSFTPSFTSTITPTFTVTLTNTITPTISMTGTITLTPTISQTFTVSPTYTVSPTITQTWTDSPTFTVTPTFTITPSITETDTETYTQTVSPTSTVTPTITETLSMTNTYTYTPTGTQTFTSTATLSVTVTRTASATVTPTPSLTATITGTPNYTAAKGGDCYVFPQPSSNSLTFVFSSDSGADMTVKIYNAAGMPAAVLNARAVPGNYNYIYLDLSRFAPGIYYYIMTGNKDQGGSFNFGVKKFMVAK